MHRLLPEILMMASGSVMIAAAVLLAGTRGIPAESELVLPTTEAERICRVRPVRQFLGSGVGGSARLCVAQEAVEVTMHAENLTVGDSYTIWLNYLDRKRPRTDGTLDDPLGERPSGSAGPIVTRVADARAVSFSGVVPTPTLRLSDDWEATLHLFRTGPSAAKQGRVSDQQLLFPPSLVAGMPPASTAEVGEIGSIVASAVFRDDSIP